MHVLLRPLQPMGSQTFICMEFLQLAIQSALQLAIDHTKCSKETIEDEKCIFDMLTPEFLRPESIQAHHFTSLP